MTYSTSAARNNFALWAAYRAAQAGSAKATRKQFTAALRKCGVIEFLAKSANHKIAANLCMSEFHKWTKKAQKHLETIGKPIKYGIAAKLVSVYFKSAFVLCGNEKTRLACNVPPPIDSHLLNGIDKASGTNLSERYKWTKLEKKDYKELLKELREIYGKEKPLWHLEKYWLL